MVRLAATAPQIPAPSLAHIPALVIKFAPAKVLFGAVNAPSKMATRSIGFYAKGCLAGGKPLPVNGPAWQAMRLSRNRMWGHPTLVRYIERFAKDAKAKDGWPGLLVGDMSMPRGGPMPFGHASHQVGLDVDIWYKPMPDRVLTNEERETMPMETFLLDPGHVNPEGVDAGLCEAAPPSRVLPRGRARVREPRDQEVALRQCEGRPRLPAQDHSDHGP